MANYATQGWIGFVKVDGGGGNVFAVRCTSADIKLSQEITYPEVVDGRADTTIYQMGPKVVGGNLAFPLVHEGGAMGGPRAGCAGNATSLAGKLWQFATVRNTDGRLSNVFNATVRYADNLAYRYDGCIINTMGWTVNQGESINVSCEVIGGAKTDKNSNTLPSLRTLSGDTTPATFLAPARVVTWNDITLGVNVEGTGQAASIIIPQEHIREFAMNINNNAERYYTFNHKLAPQDVSAKKREISGTMKLMGHHPDLSSTTENNESRFSSDSNITFKVSTYFGVKFTSVIFDIEEVSLVTGLFETTTKWRAMGDCNAQYSAQTVIDL